MKGKKIIRLF